MKVELYIGYVDHTWDTTTVEIPDDTPEEDVERVAVSAFDPSDAGESEFVFVGIYNSHADYMDDEEDEEEEDVE